MTCSSLHYCASLAVLCIVCTFSAVQSSFERQTYAFLVNPRIYEVHPDRKIVEFNGWSLQLDAKDYTIASDTLRTEWIRKDGSKTMRNVELCHYGQGVVYGAWNSSWAAMTECNGSINGYLSIDDEVYTIEPLSGNSTSNVHSVTKVKLLTRTKRQANRNVEPEAKWSFFNLTGDTIDLDVPSVTEETVDETEEIAYTTEDIFVEEPVTPRRSWRREEIDTDLGYFYDTAWERSPIIVRDHGNQPQQIQKIPTKWLKIAVGVDHTVVGFHGKASVEKYVLALMNIVNAIYSDPSLKSEIRLVITKLMFYEHKRQSVVKPGNAKRSLENVNSWNRRLHLALAPGEPHHDIAVWLTRSDIGGPSGYAPIAGTCDPKRSCALIRDEGLTSSFIIAHEMAHILGLSHDGDFKSGNNCSDEALEGSVMAPMVSATFHRFSWSKCSQKEFMQNSVKWTCLSVQPPRSGDIILNSTLQNTFSMDEQCRMEFGEGYSLCRAFDIVEPCSHLWCGHSKSPLVCKTKKGPPLEGTGCGFDKWCINGYCEDVDVRSFGKEPVVHNPQDGGWSEWGPWGACSRTCGTGVSFRIRKCDNPPPKHGGNDCFGLAEEWRICNQNFCPEPIGDIRAEQCSRFPSLLDIPNVSKSNITWLPYESDQMDLKCKLICVSQATRELHVTDENLIDGTPCSYENSSNICIQGTCQPLGCDGKLFSSLRVDSCGTCGGNNTDCVKIETTKKKPIRRELSRVTVIPRLAREIKFEINTTVSRLVEPAVAFVLKNRRRKKYSVTIPNTGYHTEIVEGTKFYYKKYRNRHSIWAKGPVLAEIVVLMYTPKRIIDIGIDISSWFEYFAHNDSLNGSKRFTWILGGWGPCSVSCGGGRRQRTAACWDNQHEKIVRKKHCSLASKPFLASEKCNTFSCNFHWIAGEWEPCSTTCGSRGVQSRELYCVPQSVLNMAVYSNNGTVLQQPWRYMVAPNKCPDGNKPSIIRPCQRIACMTYWVYEEWAQCSTSCGYGISSRSPRCPDLEDEPFSVCEGNLERQTRQCLGEFNRFTNPLCRHKKKFTCIADQSKYCSLSELSKYCRLSGFRRLCCKSCSQIYTINAVS